MSIKPVDFQVMLPKTSEISKMNSDDQHKNMILQQQQAATFQTKAETNLRQVHSQERTQDARIREKREKNQEGKKKDKKNKFNNNNDPNASTIDIRL